MSDLAGLDTAPPAERARPAAAAAIWQWRRDERDARRGAAAAARRRGAIGGAIGIVAAGVLALWRPGMAIVVGAIALLFTALAMLSPLGAFAAVNRALDAFGRLVGTAMTVVLMALAYYLIFLPCGLLLRASGALRISRRADPRLPSYWVAAPPVAPGPEPYRKPF